MVPNECVLIKPIAGFIFFEYNKKMQKEKKSRIYDGGLYCDCGCGKCPVVDYNAAKKEVTLSDPAKPERGAFTMTSDEYNTLLKNAKEIK